MEERILLSGDIAPPPPDPHVSQAAQHAQMTQQVLSQMGKISTRHADVSVLQSNAGAFAEAGNSLAVTGVLAKAQVSNEIVFVDAGVSNYESLVDGLATDLGAQTRNIEVVVLDARSDGIDQISHFLAEHHDISAIHILSHGADGSLKLGNTVLDHDDLDVYADRVAMWGKALKSDGDILLYGCNVASDQSGVDFVNRLSHITGADVAASDDLTGGKGYGDWDLEYATGQIDVAQAFNAGVESTYANALNYTVGGVVGGAGTTGATDIFKFDINGLLTAGGVAITATLDGLGGAPASLGPPPVAAAPDVLDFSAYAGNLTFAITAPPAAGAGPSSVTITDVAGNRVTANNFGKIIGGSGNDKYIFNPGWGNITIQDTTGTNDADFALVKAAGTVLDMTSSVDPVSGLVTATLSDTPSVGTNTASLQLGSLGQFLGTNLDLTTYQTQITNYLAQLQSFGSQLDTFGQFANALPGINQSLGTVLNVADMLAQFKSDISTYINGANPTSDGLVTQLSGLAVNATPNATGAIAGSYSGVSSALSMAASGVELGFNLDFNVTRTANWAVDLGTNAALQGIKLPTVNVSVGATFDLNAMLGIQLNATPAVFMDVSNLSGSASVNAALSGFTVDFGFLTAKANGGAFNLSAALKAAFKDPAGDGVNRLSLSDLDTAVGPIGGTGTGAGAGSLIASLAPRGVDASGVVGAFGTKPSFSFTLPVTVSDVTGVTGGTIRAALANVFSGQDPSVTVSKGLTDFGNIGAADMLGMLRQLDDWLSQLSGTSILNQKVPMTQNTTLGDTLNFGVAFKNDVLNTLFTTDAQGNQTPNFTSAQTLATKLTSALQALPGMTAATVAAAFNTTSRELRYRLDWSHSFVSTSVPVNFQLDLGSLAGVQSTSTIPINANATLGFDFGIKLTPSQQLSIAPPNFVPNANPVPTNGQLTANATFNVTLFETTTITDANGVVTSTTHAAPVPKVVTVTKTSTTTPANATPADLVFDVQSALDTAFGANKVKASYDGSRIVLTGVNSATITRTIEVGSALGHTAYTELGLPPANLTGAAHFDVTVTTPSTGAAVTKTIAVTMVSTGTNQSIADLTADVQAAVDMAFHSQLRGGAIALGLGATSAPVDFNAVMMRDQTFQLQLGSATPVQVTLTANPANGDATNLVSSLQTAITTALGTGAGSVTVSINGDRLSLTGKDATGAAATVNILQPDVVVSHQGGRIVMNATPATQTTQTTQTTTTSSTGVVTTTTTTNVERTIQLAASSIDPAYTVMGLLNQPTPVNGVLSTNAEFNIKVNGTNYNVVVPVVGTNASIADLVVDVNTALNTAVNAALTTAGIGGSVQAFQVKDSGGNLSNAIGFQSVGTGISSLVVSVPQDLTAGGTNNNAAVNDLGFDPSADIAQTARATEFFVDNATLSGDVTFDMSAIAASAHFGFLGVDLASSTGDAISGTAALNLVNPTASGGGTRVLLTTLGDNLRGGTIGNVVTGTVLGNASVNLVMTPQTGFFTGVTPPQAKFSISLPNNFDWLNNKVVNTAAPATPVAGELHVNTQLSVISGNLSDFTNFKQMGFADILATLNKAVDYLHSTEGTTAGGGSAGSALVSVLDKKIPVINQSATDLIGLADRFAQVVTQLQAKQADSIQMADRFIKQALGLPLFNSGTTTSTAPIIKFDTTGLNQTLRLDIPFTVAVNKTLPIDLDLVALGSLAGITFPSKMKKFVGVSSTGDLNLSASATLNLALGMDITGTGASVAFTPFLYTGAGNTNLDFNVSANGTNLNFTAQAGPFGIHIINGTASANEGISFNMAAGSGKHFFTNPFTASDFNVGAPTGTAIASLPTFFPSPSTPIGGVGNNLFTLDVTSVGSLFDTVSFPKVPSFSSLIALTPLGMLNNPAILIDGLDMLLLTLQDSLNSQVLNTNLPFIGQAMEPAAQFISNFRSDLLAPLSLNLRAAGGTADQIVANTLFNVFGSATDGATKQFGLGQLGFLKDTSGDGLVTSADIVRQGFGLTDTFGQFDFLIGDTYWLQVPTGFDLGIPGFGLDLNANVLLSIDWSIRFSFGVDQNKGFYFYTSNNKPNITFNSVKGANELLPGATPFANPNEINITATAQLASSLYVGATSGSGPLPTVGAASATGTLGFLKLQLTDGVGTAKTIANETMASNKTRVVAGFAVDVKDPNNDGFLTFAEMTAPSTSFSNLLSTTKSGGAFLGLKTKVDFSGLNLSVPGVSVASLLPSISFDFAGTWDFSNNFKIKVPVSLGGALTSMQFQNIQLDAGSLITKFIKPFLDQFKFAIGPLSWLIGPSGMLNLRMPMISDLMGYSVNLNTLAGWFGTADFQNFLNSIQNIYNLINMAAKLPSSGLGQIGFGTIDFSNIDFSNVKNLKSLIPSISNPLAVDEKNMQQKATNFVASAKGGGIKLDILTASSMFKLLLGADDVNLITFDLPKASLAFNYFQRFAVFPPLFATLQGGFSAAADLAIGYDTRGLTQFAATHNANTLLNGFFLHDLNLTTGVDKAEAVLNGTIAAGAQIYGGVVSAGVAGGINANVNFNLNDPNRDGKVRLGEMNANIKANNNNPLAIFDINGKVDWFFKAYAKVGFYLFKKFIGWQKTWNLGGGTIFDFNIGFARPGVAAQKVGSELWVNTGPNAFDRIQGNVSDINEHVVVQNGTGIHAGQYKVDVYNRDSGGLLATSFLSQTGISKIVIDGGAGNDSIEVNGITKPIEVHGGTGDDIISLTGASAPLDTLGKPQINIFGDDGNDVINLNLSTGIALIRGGKGNDTITGGSGADQIYGEEGNDSLNGGAGNDQLTGGTGNDVLAGDAGSDTYFFANNFGIDTVNDAGGVLDTWDFTKVTTDINFTLNALGTTADVVSSVGTVTDSVSEVTNLLAVDQLLGGRGADTFDVFNIGANNLTLNGQGGSDTYILNAPLTSAGGMVTLNDTGNLWDRDAMIAKGTASSDTITVTDQSIVFGTLPPTSTVNFGTGGGIETMEVLGFGGNDIINVEATPKTMSVSVDGGSGSDIISIGTAGITLIGGTTVLYGLNGIQGSVLTGNLDIKGGSAIPGNPTETDVLNVTDAADFIANSGTMTDSLISGLGMAVGIDYATIETLNVLLGSAVDTFTVQSTIGGATNVFGNAGADILDIQNAAGTFMADGGLGNDIITLHSTALATNATLLGQAGNDHLNVLAVAGPTTVRGGANDDMINIGSKAPLVIGGVVNNIQGSVTVGGDAGIDILNVDDSGDTGNNRGTLTATTLTGLGMSDGITYGTLETLNLNLGGTNTGARSSNTLDIKGTSALTNVVGGQGQTLFNVSSDAPTNFGILDQVQGVLNITSNGMDTLNISDFGRLLPDIVGISNQTVSGTSHADINYFEAGGKFTGGINVNTGQGADTVSITSALAGDVTSLWTNAGNDVITATSTGLNGLLVAFAGVGNDTINAAAWNTGMVGFGDNGMVSYSGSVRNPFTIVRAETIQASVGGNDSLIGGSGSDYFFGGFGSDLVSGGAGNDFLIGDSGSITFVNGVAWQAGTQNFLTGGADILKGGFGNNFLFGGAGSDLLYGSLSHDVMFGDNGRITLLNGKVNSAVMLGQAPLDLIASTMFGLYISPFVTQPQVEVAGDSAGNGNISVLTSEGVTDELTGQIVDSRDAVEESSYFMSGFLPSTYHHTGDISLGSYLHDGLTGLSSKLETFTQDYVAQQKVEKSVATVQWSKSKQESTHENLDSKDTVKDNGMMGASVVAIAGWQVLKAGDRKGSKKYQNRIRFGKYLKENKKVGNSVGNGWFMSDAPDDLPMTGTDAGNRIQWR